MRGQQLPSSFLTLGVDIGQSQDPTALVVIETTPEKSTHVVRFVETLPLGTPYPDVVERIVAVDARCRLDGETTAVVDASGVGKPIVDMLRARIPGGVRAVVISGGQTVTNPGPYEYVVPKRDIISSIEVPLQTHRLLVLRGLQGADDLRSELQSFAVAISERGHDTYEARSGHKDDLVLACALCLWYAERRLAHPRRGWTMRSSRWRRDGAGVVTAFRDEEGEHSIGMPVNVTVNPHVVRPAEPAPEPGPPVRKMPGPKPEPAQRPGEAIVTVGDRDRLRLSRTEREHPVEQPATFIRDRAEDHGDPAPPEVVAGAQALEGSIRPPKRRRPT
jgi:hypothetical protein